MAAVIEHKDFDEAEALLDPEIVWEHNLGEGSPEEGVYRGRGEVIGPLSTASRCLARDPNRRARHSTAGDR
jgi:hypothetical protein